MPTPNVRLSRRALVAGAGAVTGSLALGVNPAFAQTPEASPVASPTSPIPAIDQITLYGQLRDDLLARGRALIGALVAGEYDAFTAQLSPELADLVGGDGAREFMAALQTNRVVLTLPDLGVWMNGHYDGTGSMAGYFYQGGGMEFVVETDVPQGGDVPTGTWSGTIGPGVLDLGIEITFTGTVDDFSATLAVPSQGMTAMPFGSATLVPEQPIGRPLDDEGLPVLPAVNLYRAAYAWGDAILVFNAGPADDETWGSLELQAMLPLPADPAEGSVPVGEYRLPADAQLFVAWGGDTEFRNYHAATAQQRHANDLLIWRSGGSCPEGSGMANEDYYIWGLPLVAPVAGTVVATINDLPDILPSINPDSAASMPATPAHPAGNHVVIQVADSEFVFVCHMQEGSVAVSVGDEVQPGDPIGVAGNSGNTSEPHIHIHIQTAADLFDPATIGLPLVFRDLQLNGRPVQQATGIQGTFIEPA